MNHLLIANLEQIAERVQQDHMTKDAGIKLLSVIELVLDKAHQHYSPSQCAELEAIMLRAFQ